MIDLSPLERELLERLLPAPLLQSLRQPEPAHQALVEACERLTSALALLIPFVPTPAVDLQLARPIRSGGRGVQVAGSVMLVDLSGFTAMSSQLAAAGRRGDEEVTAIVRRLYGALIEEIEGRGGRLMSIGGGTLAVLFDAARLGDDHAAHACDAALALQARMADFAAVRTSAGVFQLRLRVAVHSGQVFTAEVGDASHLEQVATGAAINRVVGALESAAPGEVIISDATLPLLAGAQVQRKLAALYLLRALPPTPTPTPAYPPAWRPPAPSPAAVTALIERVGALHAYLPHGLPQRFLRAKAADGEFRPVTMLTANFYAFGKLLSLLELVAVVERDMEIVGRVLNTYYTRIQAIVQRYGGGIHAFDMATFGDRLVALFGAPATHEDDTERAVRAALEIRASHDATNREVAALLDEWTAAQSSRRALLRVANVRLQQRAAIASGVAFAGVVGTQQRREYMVLGEVTYVAARALAAACEGDLLLTSLTYRAARGLVEVEPLAPLTRLHAAKPVPVFRVLRARAPAIRPIARAQHAAPLVGRRRELAQLSAIAEAALKGGAAGGRVVALIGEPGIGKSRLAAEALRAPGGALPEVALVWAECHSYEHTTPYVAIARALRQALELPPTGDRAAQAAFVTRQVAALLPDWSRFSPLLGPLFNLPIAETALTRALSPEQQRDRLHDLIVQICLATARRRPLALAFDDLQWADASSRALIGRLAAELPGAPLLLLLIYRPSPDLAEPWCDLEHASAIQLGALARADSAALLGALLDGSPPRALLPLIDWTQGTPFFLEETVRYMIDSGALRRNGAGAWECISPIRASNMPAQIEQLITARLDRLSDEARALIQIAAVIGQQFSQELLALVSQQQDMLAPQLAELLDTALIVPDEHAPAPTYRLRHALIHEVVYTGMLFARRQELHEHIAAVIEVMYADELDGYEAVLAHHHLRAGHIDRAFPHLLGAAQRAQARYALSEALTLYRQALAIAPWRDYRDEPPDIRAATLLHENMGDLLALTGDYGQAREHYERLLGLLKTNHLADRGVRQAALQRKIGSAYENQGTLDLALTWLRRAEDTIRAADSGAARIEHAQILGDIGWVHFRQGDLDQAQQRLDQALALLDRHAGHDEQARILNRLGGVAYTRGDLALAQQYVEQGLVASERSGNLVGQASALNNLGILTQSRGQIEDSIRYGLQALEINERIGSRRELAITAINLGWALYDRSEYQQAAEYLTLAIRYASDVHDTYHRMLALLNYGRVLTAQEQWDAAGQAVRASLAIALELQLPAVQLEAQVALAEIALQQGQIEAALQTYEQALPLATDTESEEYGRFRRLEARLVAAQGDRTRAAALLAATEALFRRLYNVPEAERTGQLLGEILSAPIERCFSPPGALEPTA